MPAFYTASGVGTYVELGGMPIKHTSTGKVDIVSEPRPTAVFNGTPGLNRCAIDLEESE